MNDLVFIRNVIYSLKREYGSRIRLGKVIGSNYNLKTGAKTNQISEIRIPRAVQLPNQISLEFIRSIGGQKGLEAVTSSIRYLIDKLDIPLTFTLSNINSYVVDELNRKLDILRVDDFQYSVILTVKSIEGQRLPSNDLTDQLSVTSGVNHD